MANNQPQTELDSAYSSDNSVATPWSEGSAQLEKALVYWLSTVRPDGRPHVTPLYAVWRNDTFYFCTNGAERKGKNLAQNPHCVVTTGCNTDSGLDIVLEGDAVQITGEALLQNVANGFAAKYDWHYEVQNGEFRGDQGNIAQVYEIKPATVFGFGKGEVFSQTRWRF